MVSAATEFRKNSYGDEESSTCKALTAWYQEHNIAIYDQEGQIRSLYDILTDVNKQWGSLSKNEQAYYLNIQAGGVAPLINAYMREQQIA